MRTTLVNAKNLDEVAQKYANEFKEMTNILNFEIDADKTKKNTWNCR